MVEANVGAQRGMLTNTLEFEVLISTIKGFATLHILKYANQTWEEILFDLFKDVCFCKLQLFILYQFVSKFVYLLDVAILFVCIYLDGMYIQTLSISICVYSQKGSNSKFNRVGFFFCTFQCDIQESLTVFMEESFQIFHII